MPAAAGARQRRAGAAALLVRAATATSAAAVAVTITIATATAAAAAAVTAAAERCEQAGREQRAPEALAMKRVADRRALLEARLAHADVLLGVREARKRRRRREQHAHARWCAGRVSRHGRVRWRAKAAAR